MVSCVVNTCKNTSSKTSKSKDGITFHRFPRDKDRRRLWESSVNRNEDWCASAASAICSDHFEATDFYVTESGLRKLAIDAVPSINISPCQPQEPTISQMEPIEIKTTDTEEVITLKYKVRRLEVIAESRKRKLIMLRQNRKRLVKKLDHMKYLLHHLIKYDNKKQR